MTTTAAPVAEADAPEPGQEPGSAPRRPVIGLAAALGSVHYGPQPIPGHIIPEIYLAAVWSADARLRGQAVGDARTAASSPAACGRFPALARQLS